MHEPQTSVSSAAISGEAKVAVRMGVHSAFWTGGAGTIKNYPKLSVWVEEVPSAHGALGGGGGGC